MKTLLFVMFLISITFVSCNQSNDLFYDSQENFEILTVSNFPEFIKLVENSIGKNKSFVDNFLIKYQNNQLENSDFVKMLVILHITNSINVDALDAENIAKGVYDELSNHNNTKLLKTEFRASCTRLLKIRNAMLDECNNYPWGVDQTCKGAVMIAWWVKSSDCV